MATPIPRNAATFVLGELAASCGGRIDPRCAGRRVHGVVTDSRAVQPGELYVALRGERHDGHAFLPQVAASGAAAALVESAQGAPEGLPLVVVAESRRALGQLALAHRARWGGKVVAITGSAGKTTTKELAALALSALGHRVLSTAGNLNNEIGVPMTLLGLTVDHDVAVVELGTSQPGEIARLARVARADVGVVTSVSHAHTAGLRSLDAVADEKCALLRGLGRGGVAIYSADSEPLRARSRSFGAGRVLSFGQHESADVRLCSYELRADLTTSARYSMGAQALQIELRVTGIAAALDAAAALAVVSALHTAPDLAAAARGLSQLSPLPGRMRPCAGPQGALVIDDSYNANPASMLASLRTVVELSRVRGGRAIAALADMAELGECSQAEHERLGRTAATLGVAALCLVGGEMRHAATAARAASPSVAIEHSADALACVPWLRERLRERDAVLVKGSRSMAMERVVAGLAASGGAA